MLENLTWIIPAIKELYKGRDDAKDAWSEQFIRSKNCFLTFF